MPGLATNDYKPCRVGICGFGRIGKIPSVQSLSYRPSADTYISSLRVLVAGRAAFRASLDRDDLVVVAINHTAPSLDYLIHSIKYDSTHGPLKVANANLSISEDGLALMCLGRRITLFSERDPKKLDWESVGAEYIVESTGKMTTVESAGQHIQYGKARKVVISAPSK